MYIPRFKVGDILKANQLSIEFENTSIYKVMAIDLDSNNSEIYRLRKLKDDRHHNLPLFKVNEEEAFACSVVDYMCELDHTYKALMEFDDELANLLGENT